MLFRGRIAGYVTEEQCKNNQKDSQSRRIQEAKNSRKLLFYHYRICIYGRKCILLQQKQNDKRYHEKTTLPCLASSCLYNDAGQLAHHSGPGAIHFTRLLCASHQELSARACHDLVVQQACHPHGGIQYLDGIFPTHRQRLPWSQPLWRYKER